MIIEQNKQRSKIEKESLHFCIMSDDVYPIPSANGVCTMSIAEALTKMGHKVDIICNGNYNRFKAYDYNGIAIHSVKSYYTAPYKYSLVQRLVRVLKLRLRLPIYPIKDPARVRYYVNMYKKIKSESEIDCLISCVVPAEAAKAGKILRENELINCFVIYQLDSLGNNRFDQGSGVIQKYKRKKAGNAERIYFDSADYIFELPCNEYYYGSTMFCDVHSKIRYIDIPLISSQLYYSIRKLENDRDKETKKLCFVYAGALHKEFRDPSYIIKLISQFNNEEEFECKFEFYTKYDIKQFLEDISPEDTKIFYNKGYVSQDELLSHYASTDFLISIGNESSSEIHEIPSKIFPYISTGKPIIHITGGVFDACIPYLSRYKNALLIDPNDDFKDNYYKLKEFVDNKRRVIVDLDEIELAFKENTAEYSAKSIINAVLNS